MPALHCLPDNQRRLIRSWQLVKKAKLLCRDIDFPMTTANHLLDDIAERFSEDAWLVARREAIPMARRALFLLAKSGRSMTTAELAVAVGVSRESLRVKLSQYHKRGLVQKTGRSTWRSAEE